MITGSTFNTNLSQGNNSGYGGAIYTYAGTLSVTNSTFYLNTATTSGGAIYSQGGTEDGDAACELRSLNELAAKVNDGQ